MLFLICDIYATETPSLLANDQHPSHDVIEGRRSQKMRDMNLLTLTCSGEKLIKRVYSILRASPLWNKTAFILTYDEHGGFYDHYPIPLNDIPNPDGIIAYVVVKGTPMSP